MEAFSASKFVWSAISLIVLIMERICKDVWLIVSIALTTCCICSLLAMISSPTTLASSFAALAFSAFFST